MLLSLSVISAQLAQQAQQLRLPLPLASEASYDEEWRQLCASIFEANGLFLSSADLSSASETIWLEDGIASLLEHSIWIFCHHFLLSVLNPCTPQNIRLERHALSKISIDNTDKNKTITLYFGALKLHVESHNSSLLKLEDMLFTVGLGYSITKAEWLLKTPFSGSVLGKEHDLLFYRAHTSAEETSFVLFEHLSSSKEQLLIDFRTACESHQLPRFSPHTSELYFEELLALEEQLITVKMDRALLELYSLEEGKVVVQASRGGKREIIAAITEHGLIWNEPVENKELIAHKLSQHSNDLACQPQKASRVKHAQKRIRNSKKSRFRY